MILTNETDERMHIGYHISSTTKQSAYRFMRGQPTDWTIHVQGRDASGRLRLFVDVRAPEERG